MNDFLAKMDAGKDRAVIARNRGIATGKAAAGHRKRRQTPATLFTVTERNAMEAAIRAKLDADLAREDELRARYPERYEFFI